MRVIVVVASALLGQAAAPASPTGTAAAAPQLSTLLREASDVPRLGINWDPPPDELAPLEDALRGEDARRGRAGPVVASLAASVGIPQGPARALLSAWLLSTRGFRARRPGSDGDLRRAADLYERAATAPRAARLSATAFAYCCFQYSLSESNPLPDAPVRLERLVSKAESPGEVVLQIVEHDDVPSKWAGAMRVWAVVLQPSLAERASEVRPSHDSSAEALFDLFTLERLHRDRAAPSQIGSVLDAAIRDVLPEFPDLAAQLFLEASEEERARMLRGDYWVRRRERESRPEHVGFDDPDIRDELASALLLIGEVEVARRVRAAAVAPPPPKLHIFDEPCPRALRGRLLDEKLGGQKLADAFDLVVGAYRCPPEDAASRLLLAAAIPRANPDASRKVFRRQQRPDLAAFLPPFPALREHLGGAVGRLSAAIEAERRHFEAVSALLPPPSPRAATQPDEAAKAVRSVLLHPPSSPFRELPRTRALTGDREVGLEVRPPDGMRLVRSEREGRRATAVALSHRLDPTGEVSGGGYWILESEDGGETWAQPVYTGLRQYQPYDVVRDSTLPLRAGDTLQLEVDARELDPDSITFPPIGLRTRREERGLVVAASIEALRRDEDGDGLSDLAEARLLLDPTRPDSDSDGVPDGADVLPHVPQAASSSHLAPLLTELVAALSRGEIPRALIVGLGPHGGGVGSPGPGNSGEVLFITAERAYFAGASAVHRTIVLTPEEGLEAAKRFKPFYSIHLEIELDGTGKRAVIEHDEGWRGGLFEARRKNGAWTLELLSSWIS